MSSGVINAKPGITNEDGPVFGKTGIATTFKMHQKGFHPVILYSPFISSNTTEIHGARAGLPESTMHDITPHVEWGCAMPLNVCRFLFECLLPVAESALNVTYDEVKQRYKENNLYGHHISSVLDLNFIEDIDRSAEPQTTILHQALICIATRQADDLFMLYKALHPRLDEIKKTYQMDIHALFHDSCLFERRWLFGTRADFQAKTSQLNDGMMSSLNLN